MYDSVWPLSARRAELLAPRGRKRKVTAVAAGAVEVDESAAPGAVSCPVSMVRAGHF